jgi:hypothetical protein
MTVDDPGENIREIAERIDVVEFTGLDQRCVRSSLSGMPVRIDRSIVIVGFGTRYASSARLRPRGPSRPKETAPGLRSEAALKTPD